MMKPKKNDVLEFSSNDVILFMEWLNNQPDHIRKIFEITPDHAVRAMRNIKLGLQPLSLNKSRPL